ncbi:hypothetical protein N9948_00950 [bacterium]|nr:hypothetical protein [bacterium]
MKDTINEMHRQCTFKQAEKPNCRTVAWIPERSSKVGKQVKFKELDAPNNKIVWEVIGVGDTRKTRKEILGLKKAKFDSISKDLKKNK